MTTLTAAAVTAFLILMDPPQMPLYQIASFKIRELALTPWRLQISSTILAGLQVHNPNLVGVNVHAANVDLWYPDWSGELQWIGYLTETEKEEASTHCREERERYCFDHSMEEGEDESKCLNDEWRRLPSEPFVSIHPKRTTLSHDCAVSIRIPNLRLSVYVRMLMDAITQGGEIQILASGTAHVKSQSRIAPNLGIPLTVGVICDNSIQVTQRPIQIVGRSCVVEGVTTGWALLKDSTLTLRERAKEIYEVKGQGEAATGAEDLDF